MPNNKGTRNSKPTARQKKAVQKILENPENIGKALLEVGYSENTAIDPANVLESKGFKEEWRKYEHLIDDIIGKTLTEMSRKQYNLIEFRDLANTADKLIKIKQLVNGGPTEKTDLTVKWEQ